MATLVTDRIIDSHLHVWDPAVLDYPWLVGLPIAGRRGIGDIPTAFGDTRVDGVVAVQAECVPEEYLDEVRWVSALGLAHPGTPPVLGMVARAALETEDGGHQVRDVAAEPLVVGVRRNIQGEPDGFARGLVSGIDAVTRAGLTFDLCVTADQLWQVADLLDEVDPTGRFVLDHLGKPPVGVVSTFSDWQVQVERLAEHPTMMCKLSGLLTEVRDGEPTASTFAPYLETAVEAFGPERVMFGSDWPVCTLAGGDYGDWVEIVADVLGPDRDLQRAVFAANAVAFYGLDDPASPS